MVMDNEVVMRRCVGCGASVPDVEGPVHPYMESSPGCWQWYGELNAAGAYRADVHRTVAGDDEFARAVDAWSAEVCQAWRTHHDTVRRFAQAAVGGTP